MHNGQKKWNHKLITHLLTVPPKVEEYTRPRLRRNIHFIGSIHCVRKTLVPLYTLYMGTFGNLHHTLLATQVACIRHCPAMQAVYTATITIFNKAVWFQVDSSCVLGYRSLLLATSCNHQFKTLKIIFHVQVTDLHVSRVKPIGKYKRYCASIKLQN